MKPSLLKTIITVLCIAIGCIDIAAQETKEVYKSTKTRELEAFIDKPADWKATDKRPAIVFFFGGGWRTGAPRQFKRQADFLTAKGLVCVRVDYRLRGRDKVLPDDCVEDAISAMRWVRANAKSLGIDPDRIVAAGGSAGGHLAACAFLVDDINAPGEDKSISAKPNALLLYNPAVDLVELIGTQDQPLIQGLDESVLKRISPTHLLTKKLPPTFIVAGTADRFYPQIQIFEKKAKALGSLVDAQYVENQPHGFYGRAPWLDKTNEMVTSFLRDIGYLPVNANKIFGITQQKIP